MSSTGKQVSVLRKSPTQQHNGTHSGGKVTKTPQNRGTKSSNIVLAPMNGESVRIDETKLSGMRGRSSSFGKEEMNLMAVRKVDPTVTHILSTVSQVMLYQYDQASGEWERTSIEGTLFVCSRSSVGHDYGFMILNRLSNDNMLEEIAPNMEFRVQRPFVLFKKKSGNIFGLCFQEESICQETGQLLNSLGSQENHLLNLGHSSPKSRRNPSLNASMRSTSAPAFKQTAPATNGKPYLIDVLESGNYTSSEGENTSSPDSLTSDPISFVAATPPISSTSSTHPGGNKAAHHGNKHKQPRDQASPVSHKQHTKSSTLGKNSNRSSSPKNVPSSKGGIGGGGQGQRSQQPPSFSSGSVSPVKGRSRSPKQQQQWKQQQNGGAGGRNNGYNLSSSVGGGGRRARGEMRHAVSFDHGLSSTSPLRSFTAPTQQTSMGLQQQQQLNDFFSPQHQMPGPSSAFELLAAQVSGQQNGQKQQPPLMDKTVRRLFTPDTSSDATSKPPHSESVPTSLQSIFSQVSTSTADSTTNSNSSIGAGTASAGSDTLPLTVISLEQVEKQMVEDVPSPVSINPLALFSGGGGGAASPSAVPSTTTQPPKPATTSAAKPGTEATSQQHVLLQPSAFMPNTTSGGATVVNPSVNSVAIAIEPPSPMAAPGPIIANGGSTPTSSNLKAQLLPENSMPPAASAVQGHFFPPIPPLMHSPGMRAAPVSRVNQPLPKPQQQSMGGEPSSLVSTTVSAPHVAQTSATTTSQQVQGTGKPSQRQERPPSQSTPQRHSSQSTPSLTPLAELSVPRRSTTAPTGVLPPITKAAGGLMSPHQFVHSSSSDSGHAEVEEVSKVTAKGVEPVGLSRDQLQQAMLYLIKHDDGFLSKLHEAYQLSLSEKQV